MLQEEEGSLDCLHTVCQHRQPDLVCEARGCTRTSRPSRAALPTNADLKTKDVINKYTFQPCIVVERRAFKPLALWLMGWGISKLSLMDCQCFSNLSVPHWAKPSGLVSCRWAASRWCIPHQSLHDICHQQTFPFVVHLHTFRQVYVREYNFLTQIIKFNSRWHLFSKLISVID